MTQTLHKSLSRPGRSARQRVVNSAAGFLVAVLLIHSVAGVVWGLGWPRMDVTVSDGAVVPASAQGDNSVFRWWALVVVISAVICIVASVVLAARLRERNSVGMVLWVAVACAIGAMALYSAGGLVASQIYGVPAGFDPAEGDTFSAMRAVPLGAAVPLFSAFVGALTYWTAWVLNTRDDADAVHDVGDGPVQQ
ncbi:hypothetical membrane protein [Corynebacterium renale]|uniref:hypothetical protein n=1 Tax=Corynebacterium renale TaxID=1724 RepID=UPI000DA2D8F6|nr:hypothetical protein [Corynebacterium renale]SQG64955.1 hypothetical membrane protein [Corynebacterium renale]STC96863.1 hypothetical membrane protein [Corynebacterium renale]